MIMITIGHNYTRYNSEDILSLIRWLSQAAFPLSALSACHAQATTRPWTIDYTGKLPAPQRFYISSGQYENVQPLCASPVKWRDTRTRLAIVQARDWPVDALERVAYEAKGQVPPVVRDAIAARIWTMCFNGGPSSGGTLTEQFILTSARPWSAIRGSAPIIRWNEPSMAEKKAKTPAAEQQARRLRLAQRYDRQASNALNQARLFVAEAKGAAEKADRRYLAMGEPTRAVARFEYELQELSKGGGK